MEKLKKHKESNPFKVPEDYFSGLNDRIIANCNEAEVSKARKGIISIKPFLTLAAVISGAAVLTFAILNTIPSSGEQKSSTTEILSNVDEYSYYDIDLFMIESALTDASQKEAAESDISDDEIIEYLLSGQVELSLLYEHLGEGVEL